MSNNKDDVPVVADDGDDEYATKESGGPPPQTKQGQTSNPNYNVGGTGKDGGLSTADTVADGGEDEPEADGDYKPS